MKLTTTARTLLIAAGVSVATAGLTAATVLSFSSPSRPTADTCVGSDLDGGFALPTGVRNVASVGSIDFTEAAESTINGVVSIKSYATPQMRQSAPGGFFGSDPFFEYFFGSPQQQPRQQQQPQQPREQQLGLGSGVIISEDGYVVTNNHVIDSAERLEVTLNDNRSYEARVIGTDPMTDLALLKIDATGLPVIPMGDSEGLKIGEWVLAVGNPFGFTSTVTAGIVSAKARSIGGSNHGRRMGIESYIQTDAAVNPGNSGGALVNLAGQLIGINTAIYSQTGNYAGYSFAIPTSIVRKVVTDLRQYGTVQRAVLGVTIADLTPELAKEKDVKAVTQGVWVNEVAEKSSASAAGIQSGDVLTSIDGVSVNNMAQLQEQLAKHRPGDSITLGYIRDNKPASVTVKLLNSQGSTEVTRPTDFTSLGATLKKADEETLRKLNLRTGVEVSSVSDGIFKEAGIRKGFVITQVNDIRVSTPDDIEKIYKAVTKQSDSENLLIVRGYYPSGKRAAFALDLGGE